MELTKADRQSRRLSVTKSNTSKLASDRQGSLCANAWKPLDPVGDGGELSERRNVFSIQHVPGVEWQTQTANGSLAVLEKSLMHQLSSPVFHVSSPSSILQLPPRGASLPASRSGAVPSHEGRQSLCIVFLFTVRCVQDLIQDICHILNLFKACRHGQPGAVLQLDDELRVAIG
jgi:hypothetical protein